MKKVLILFLTFALCASLAACAGEATEPTTEPVTDPTETTAFDWSAGLNSSGSSCAMEEYHTE